MKIIYYTSGVTGTGRLVRGISIGNGLKRNSINAEYIIIHSSDFGFLAENEGFKSIQTEPEDISITRKTPDESEIYRLLLSLNPDILIVDLLWFPLAGFIDKLSCKKIFLSRQVSPHFFKIKTGDTELAFNPGSWDLLLKAEPFTTAFPMDEINPIIIRNRNEILSKEEALQRLKLNTRKKNALIAYNGHPGDFDRVKKTYSYLADVGYSLFYTTNYEEGIFPAVDYFNAFDFIVTGAGYNSFWETKFFNKEAIYIAAETRFEDAGIRLAHAEDYTFDINGADQLADIIYEMMK